MLPTYASCSEKVRQEIDRRLLTEVLGLDAEATEQLAILRNQRFNEPSMVGENGTGQDG